MNTIYKDYYVTYSFCVIIIMIEYAKLCVLLPLMI